MDVEFKVAVLEGDGICPKVTAGLGVMPSVNIRGLHTVFQPGHGGPPEITDKGKACTGEVAAGIGAAFDAGLR
ncbi:MAG: hypothetical protein RH942_09635 [Kiloniellaceae bacterium]